MKKLLLLACIISYTFNVSAQSCDSSLPVTEDFNDSNQVNVCWQFVNNDTDIYNWEVADVGGTNGIKSASYINGVGALTPDNWIISHPINLPSGSSVQLNWNARATAWNFDQENYSVYVAAGNQINDFLSSGVSFTQNLSGTRGAWQNSNLNASALSGQIVYVAFRHHGVSDQKEIDIDNLTISSGVLGIDDFEVGSFSHNYNGNNDVLTIKSTKATFVSVQIYNILGQKTINKKLSQSIEAIELFSLKDGIYIAQINTLDATKTIKFLKQ